MTASSFLAARWVLPVVGPPIEHGWIEVANRHVVAVGAGEPPGLANDLGDTAILPGLVNAHTHLELSWMAGSIPPAESFAAWMRTLMRMRRTAPPLEAGARVRAIERAVREVHDSGTVLVGDISNTLESVVPLRAGGVAARVFHEMVGFNPADPGTIVADAWGRIDSALESAPPASTTACVVAHAPYSVLPSLFPQIARRHRSGPLSIHLAESSEEVEFLHTGRGPLRDLFEELGVWTDRWPVPECLPVEYLERVGYLRPGLLVVHGVQLDDAQLERLRESGAVIVTCPRSNAWVGAGLPRVANFYASGVPVAVGTDSLASVASLNMFDELAELRRIAPDVAAASLIESATRIGAEALGFGDVFGTIAPGRRASFVTVAVPAGTTDVEEYLVGGVLPRAVRPLTL